MSFEPGERHHPARAVGADNDAPDEGAWPGTLYAAWVTCVLTLAYSCSFIDRQILTLLIGPIRRDLHVSDTQVSLLGGIAFTIFYTLLGMPLARLADRAHRRNLMAAGLATWSTMTALCGVALISSAVIG